MGRKLKRSIIILIYLVLFGLFIWGVVWLILPAPTCSDGKQNQRESGVDCGGPCSPCVPPITAEPLQVVEKALVPTGQGNFDVVTRIKNPNIQYGSAVFSYEIILKDAAGSVVATRSGRSFILPVETKYIIEPNIKTSAEPTTVEVNISGYQWQQFSGYEEPGINVYNKRYSLIASGAGFSEVYGLLKNESEFDFNLIKISVILRDVTGKVLAVNNTEMKTVNASGQRDLRLIWPVSFPGEVVSVEIEAEANLYDSQNFIKQYFPGGKFQQR